jgi:hypothetical protein
MTLSPALPTFLLQTILAHLTMLFLAGTQGDQAVARQAAIEALADHQPQTGAELRLAAKVVAFNLQMLEALGQAASLDVPMAQILRLRSGAVSLNRQADKAENRLHGLQQAIPPEPQQAKSASKPPYPVAPWPKAQPGSLMAALQMGSSSPETAIGSAFQAA